jgi:predicted nucleic acid-binding protein
VIAFLDASVVARRYLPEAGSDRIRALMKGPRELAVSRLTIAEVAAAVGRAWRSGTIDALQRDAIIERLSGDFAIVDLKRAIVERVPALVVALPLRTADALQLACCLSIRGSGKEVELWSNDGQLSAAARAEGVKTVAL